MLLTELSSDLLARLANCLPPHDVACSLRLVNKAAARSLKAPQFITIRLSHPEPCYVVNAFVHKMRAPGALRGYSLIQQHRIHVLAARSGTLPLIADAGVGQLAPDALSAAAGAGQLHVVSWILQRIEGGDFCVGGRDPDAARRAEEVALTAALEAGQSSIVEWLHGRGCAFGASAAVAAARGGQARLLEWLLTRVLPPLHNGYDVRELLQAAARGCDLPTLQRLHVTYGPAAPAFDAHGFDALMGRGDQMMAAAAGSPTPDHLAKLLWLESRGYPRCAAATAAAAAQSDAAERLAWLRGRGYPVDWGALYAAVQAGNDEAVAWLLSLGPVPMGTMGPVVVLAAAGEGRLGALRLLRGAGLAFPAGMLRQAAKGGHLPVVEWLLMLEAEGAAGAAGMERAGAAGAAAVGAAAAAGAATGAAAEARAAAEALPRGLTAQLFADAASSGCVALLAWLRARGCPWDDRAFVEAAAAGAVPALEWLAEHGCPMGDDGFPYMRAGRNMDWATLECLRRLGCPWGTSGLMLTLLARGGCGVELLQWMVQAGCQPNWRAMAQCVQLRTWEGGPTEEVREWVRTRGGGALSGGGGASGSGGGGGKAAGGTRVRDWIRRRDGGEGGGGADPGGAGGSSGGGAGGGAKRGAGGGAGKRKR